MATTLPVPHPEPTKTETSPTTKAAEISKPALAEPESQPTTTKEGTEAGCGCDLPTETAKVNGKPSSTSSEAALTAIPSTAELLKIAELPLLDAEGKSRTFKSIYGDPTAEKHLIIFVRHFFCNICQEYLKALSAAMPPASVAAISPPTKITIIGCGSPELIARYLEQTNLPYSIYTDPTQQLYKALKLGRTLDLGPKKPAYLGKKSMGRIVVDGVLATLSAGRNIWKGGDWYQIGGEFLFVKDPSGDWEIKWCHRMTNTRDHAEIDELEVILGLDEKNDTKV